jgi:hypothetical protein
LSGRSLPPLSCTTYPWERGGKKDEISTERVDTLFSEKENAIFSRRVDLLASEKRD